MGLHKITGFVCVCAVVYYLVLFTFLFIICRFQYLYSGVVASALCLSLFLLLLLLVYFFSGMCCCLLFIYFRFVPLLLMKGGLLLMSEIHPGGRQRGRENQAISRLSNCLVQQIEIPLDSVLVVGSRDWKYTHSHWERERRKKWKLRGKCQTLRSSWLESASICFRHSTVDMAWKNQLEIFFISNTRQRRRKKKKSEKNKYLPKCLVNDIMYYFNFVWTIILNNAIRSLIVDWLADWLVGWSGLNELKMLI